MAYVIRTKVNKDSVEKTTTLNINWEDCNVETLRAIALSAIIIKVQAQWRKAEGGIPAVANINAVDYKPGTRVAPVVKIEALVSKMSLEEKEALIKQMQEQIDSELGD